MNDIESAIKGSVAEHVARLREMAKEADDFAIRLALMAHAVEHQYRYLLVRAETEQKTEG